MLGAKKHAKCAGPEELWYLLFCNFWPFLFPVGKLGTRLCLQSILRLAYFLSYRPKVLWHLSTLMRCFYSRYQFCGRYTCGESNWFNIAKFQDTILYPVLYVANREINLISFYYQYFIYYNIERLHIDQFIMSRGFFDDYWGKLRTRCKRVHPFSIYAKFSEKLTFT